MTTRIVTAISARDARAAIHNAHVVRVSVEVGSNVFAEVQISKREALTLVTASVAGGSVWVPVAGDGESVLVIGRQGF